MSIVEDKEPLSQKLIDLVRKNDFDAEITSYIDSWLEEIFLIGFGPEDAVSVVDSFFMHDDCSEVNFENKDLISIIKEISQKKTFIIECPNCDKHIDMCLIVEPYESCPGCKKKINYWKDYGLCWSDSIPYGIVYEEYAKNTAERIYKNALKKKLDNRITGQSDLDVFKTICIQLFKEHNIEFMVYPWNEYGCTSWLYTDILQDIYESEPEGCSDRNKPFRIDTDQLLYDDRTCFFAEKWKHRITLLKAFNGKIKMSIENLNPIHELKYSESLCYLKMDWKEKSRNIPKKKLLYSMPYIVIYLYFFLRNLSFTLYSRPKQLLREKFYKYEYRLKQILRIKEDPPF